MLKLQRHQTKEKLKTYLFCWTYGAESITV